MICQKCGSKNQENSKYCTKCGTKIEKVYNEYEKQSVSLKKEKREHKTAVKRKKWYESKYTLIILIVIISILSGCIYGLLKNKNITTKGTELTSSVEVDSVSVTELYGGTETSIDGDTIKTSVNSTIEVTPKILKNGKDINLNEVNIDYKISDTSLVDFNVNNNVFTGMANESGVTTINIYYNDKVIKTLTLIIKDKEPEYNVTQEELESTIENLEYAYQRALETGDVSFIYPYVTKDGKACKAYEKYIPQWYDEGKTDYIIESSVQYGQMRIVENESNEKEYIVPRTAISQISDGGKSYEESGYIEFVLVYRNGGVYVDRLENSKSNVTNQY